MKITNEFSEPSYSLVIHLNDLDAVKNQLPNGGVIVSIASSGGLGIAPLVGAKVLQMLMLLEQSRISSDLIRWNYTTITDFIYDGVSGIGTVTTDGPHGFKYSDLLILETFSLIVLRDLILSRYFYC